MKGVIALTLIGAAAWLVPGRLPAAEPDGIAAAAALESAFVKAIESAEKSVVSIARDRIPAAQPQPQRRPNKAFPFPNQDERLPGIESPDFIPNEFGAGIVIDENGLILTNYHLVRGGAPVEAKPDFKAEQTLYVRLPDRRGFEARIYAADPRSDLAVLKIAATDLKPIRLGNASSIRKGQFVIALGNPYLIARDGSASATWGIVSNLTRQALPDQQLPGNERRRGETIQNLGILMHVDTRLDLGTSGGALINLNGELVGITTSLASIVGFEKSAGFALPVDDSTRRIIESLRQGKEVEYGFLGVVMPDDELLASDIELAPIVAKFGQYGAARVGEVFRNLPGERGGLHQHDLVVNVAGKPIRCRNDLMREVGMLAPGTQVPMRVWRPNPGRAVDLNVEIGKWPRDREDTMITSTRLREPWRGLTVDYPTARLRLFKQQHPERNAGVMILDVGSDSPAAAADLHPEDVITHVNGKPVRNPREFMELTEGETGLVRMQVLPAALLQAVPRTVEIRPE